MLKRLFVLMLGLVLIGGITLYTLINMPEKEKIDPISYFEEFTEGQLNMVYEDKRIDQVLPVIKKDNQLYIESTFAHNAINSRVFYDEAEGILTVTNLQEVIRVQQEDAETSALPVIVEADKLYIGETYLEEEFAVAIEEGVDGRLVMVSDLKTSKEVAKVTARTSELRTHPSKKTKIVDGVKKDEEVIIYGEEDGYFRVRNQNGMVGYIPSKDIKVQGSTEVKLDKAYESKPVTKPIEGKVKLAWDQMTVRTDGNWNSNKYTNIQGANVISPTWFEFKDGEGNLMDRGSTNYVQSAHSRGLQVWALMSHNFTEWQHTEMILTSTAKRQRVIDQLVQAVNTYNLDGINIDIENVQAEFGQEWLQFMRELYPQLNALGVTVSVDVYMPSAWSKHYMRSEVAEVVDYFIVMAYDQHWSGSEVAGPVAGLYWLEEGLKLNLEEVPKEKLVLGMPLYTRVWQENPEGLKSKAYGMVASQKIVKDWGVTPVFDDEHGQYYAQYTEGDKVYKVWIEDTETLKKRLEIMASYDLAGYAVWKIGLEDKAVWDILSQVK